MWPAFNLHETHAATADWFQSWVVAKRGNINAEGGGGVENGNAISEFMRLAVDSCANHFQVIL